MNSSVRWCPARSKRRPNVWTGQSFHLHRTDGEGEWTVRLGPDGEVSTEHAHGKGDVALRGPASSLYLWCLNRVPADELEVFGDPAVAALWTPRSRSSEQAWARPLWSGLGRARRMATTVWGSARPKAPWSRSTTWVARNCQPYLADECVFGPTYIRGVDQDLS